MIHTCWACHGVVWLCCEIVYNSVIQLIDFVRACLRVATVRARGVRGSWQTHPRRFSAS